MDPESRRSAIRSFRRIQFAVLVVAAVLTLLLMHVCSAFREFVGKGGFPLITCLGAVAFFTAAVCLNEYLPRRLFRLYCPHCRKWLNDLRSMNRLWATGECRHCRLVVPIARSTHWQRIVDFAFWLGGGFVLWAIYWFMLRRE